MMSSPLRGRCAIQIASANPRRPMGIRMQTWKQRGRARPLRVAHCAHTSYGCGRRPERCKSYCLLHVTTLPSVFQRSTRLRADWLRDKLTVPLSRSSRQGRPRSNLAVKCSWAHKSAAPLALSASTAGGRQCVPRRTVRFAWGWLRDAKTPLKTYATAS